MNGDLPIVDIIILNWNGYEDTINCIESIRKNDFSNYNLILVDNGSEKTELNQLKSWCKENYSQFVIYSRSEAVNGGKSSFEKILKTVSASERLVFIENDENLGFAGGNNVGIRYALQNNVQYVMLLNNDTVIEKNTISLLMKFLIDQSDYVAVTPQIRYFDPPDKIWNCGGKITWFGNRRYYFAESAISEVPQTGFKRISFVTGCALLFKPELTGILTEKFFFGEEDLDFSFRQKIGKKKMACYFPSVIYHKVNASINKVNTNVLGSVYLFYLARLINNKQYSGRIMFFIKVVMHVCYAIPMITIRYKISIRQSIRMMVTLIKELKMIDKIDKNYHLRFLKEDFNKPIALMMSDQ